MAIIMMVKKYALKIKIIKKYIEEIDSIVTTITTNKSYKKQNTNRGKNKQ